MALPVERMEQCQSIREPLWRYDLGKIAYADGSRTLEQTFEDYLVPGGEMRDLELSVWQQPTIARNEHGQMEYVPNYVVGADVSEGLDHGDYSTIAVIDTNTMEVVATAKAHFPLQMFDLALEAVGRWYHLAMIGPERNNHGAVPINQLHLRGYERLYRMDSYAAIKTGDRTIRYGYHTNRATKPKLVSDLGEYLGDGALMIHDERFIHEARTFLSDGKGGYGASGTNHDDMVMGVGVALQLALDVGQSPTIFHDPAPGPPTMGQVLQVVPESEIKRGAGLAGRIGGTAQNAEPARKSWVMEPA
jgi:hypothetical protein